MPSIAEMKSRLEARRAELKNEVVEIDQTLREPESRDDEDRATEREEDEVLEGLGNAALEEISAIDAALRRIELGTYGECTVCGKPVNEARLDAIPHVALCIDCAS